METLAALALLGVVMGAVASALDLYWRYRNLSSERVTESQLLRGIAEDLTSDLRALSVPTALPLIPVLKAQNSDIQSSAVDAQFREAIIIEERFLQVQSSEETPVHFVGTENTLALLTDRENSRFSVPSAGYGPVQPHHVIWWNNQGNSLRLPLSHQGPKLSISALNVNKLPKGLLRSERATVGDRANPSTDLLDANLVAEHITSIAFRYFNGTRWVHEWNSFRDFRLPRAVEVSIVLNRAGDRPVSFVIDIPQSWPHETPQ